MVGLGWSALLFVVVVFALGFTTGAVLGSSSKRQFITNKIRGRLPYLSWGEIIRLGISFWRPWHIHGSDPLSLCVQVKEDRQGAAPVLWKTPLGPFWAGSGDGAILSFLLAEQLGRRIYEREPVLVRQGDIVLDAGAHLGTFTRYALNHGARRVIAFEPEPTNILCFKKTFEDELRSEQVVLVEAALWEHSGTLNLSLVLQGSSASGSVVVNRFPATTVTATTVDETVAQLNLDRVDFIKMDIEGAERYALRGARQTIARFAPRMSLAIEHWLDDAEAIPKAVLEAKPDYRVFAGDSVLHFYCR